jgi:hypothetical protein
MRPTDPITSEEALGLVNDARDILQQQIDAIQQQLLQLQQLQAEVEILKYPPPPPPKSELSSPMQKGLILDDATKSITLADANGNQIVLGPQGITLNSPQSITLSSRGSIFVQATAALALTSAADASLNGLNVAIDAQVGASLKGSATAEVSASGQTTIRGAMVMIN